MLQKKNVEYGTINSVKLTKDQEQLTCKCYFFFVFLLFLSHFVSCFFFCSRKTVNGELIAELYGFVSGSS